MQEAQSRAATALQAGAAHLAHHFHRISDAFELCLVTYALHVANNDLKEHAFSSMRAHAIVGE